MDRSVFRLRAPHAALLILFAVLAFAGGAGDAQAIEECGNNQCGPFENINNCPQDCGGFCGDGMCHGVLGENCGTCPQDCANSCITLDIFSPLKKPNCAGDDDNDCLDNDEEQDLAFWFSPHYFYDEDESCSGAHYTQGGAQTLHFGRRDFFQVRPDDAPFQWQPDDGVVKKVDLTYFLLHPHDCRWDFGFAGHQGDSESIVFHLVSTDLRRWTLASADFRHHGYSQEFSGNYLRQRASEIGTAFPIVAADQNSHGSWPGRAGSSSDCAGSEDDLCLGTCDCFRGTMQSALASNFREFPATFRNVGGPPPEKWRSQVVAVSGTEPNVEAFSVFDVGHGANVEFWTPRTDHFKTFCGWQCAQRTSSGDCFQEIHDRRNCTPGGLAEKVDTNAFTPPPFTPVSLPWDPDPVLVENLRTEIGSLVIALGYLPTVDVEGWLGLLRETSDPVGVVAPQVAGRPFDRQHESLAWFLQGPAEKYEAVLAPGLLPPDGLTREEIEHAAGEFLAGLVDRLAQVTTK